MDQNSFDSLIDNLLCLDIMKTQKKALHTNHDLISLNPGRVAISSSLGYKSFLEWTGATDTIAYSVKKDYSPFLLESILCSEIPVEYIPHEWLQIFEKHENKFSDNISFDVDINAQRKKGNLQFCISNNKSIKFLRKKL